MGPLSFSPSRVCRWVVIRCLVGGSVVVVSVTRLVLIARRMPALPSGLHHETQCRINLKKTALTQTEVRSQTNRGGFCLL